jgi:hypothetical protein
MGTIIECPSCCRPLHVATDLLAYPLNCPACKTTFEVLDAGTTARVETRALEAISPADDEPEEEERPWERREQRRVRRDCEPHRGGTVLLLGIIGLGLSLMGWPGVVGLPIGITAWVMAHGDLRKIRAGEMDPGGHSLTRAGRICGIIGTLCSSCFLLLIVAGFTLVIPFAILGSTRPGKGAPVPPSATPAMQGGAEDDDK